MITDKEAIHYIEKALCKSLNIEKMDIQEDTDLVAMKILDSLDSMLFIMTLSEITGKEFPEEGLLEKGLFRVKSLIEFLTE